MFVLHLTFSNFLNWRQMKAWQIAGDNFGAIPNPRFKNLPPADVVRLSCWRHHVCASTVGDGETKLGLNWKLLPWMDGFHCARRNHTDGWWRIVANISAWLLTLRAKILTYQTGGIYLCNSGSGVMGKTNSLLPGFKAILLERTKTCGYIGHRSQWGSTSYHFTRWMWCVCWVVF